jgi:hypothetical protein
LDNPCTHAIKLHVGSEFKPVPVHFFGTHPAVQPFPPEKLNSSRQKPTPKLLASQLRGITPPKVLVGAARFNFKPKKVLTASIHTLETVV